MAVLLSRSAVGTGLTRGSAGQTQRAAGHGLCMAATGRKAYPSLADRRTTHHGWSHRDCDGLERNQSRYTPGAIPPSGFFLKKKLPSMLFAWALLLWFRSKQPGLILLKCPESEVC